MNREHNSLATALEQVRTILMEVPNCNDRGNYMEAFLGCTVQIATEGIFAPLFRFAVYLNAVESMVSMQMMPLSVSEQLLVRFGVFFASASAANAPESILMPYAAANKLLLTT